MKAFFCQLNVGEAVLPFGCNTQNLAFGAGMCDVLHLGSSGKQEKRATLHRIFIPDCSLFCPTRYQLTNLADNACVCTNEEPKPKSQKTTTRKPFPKFLCLSHLFSSFAPETLHLLCPRNTHFLLLVIYDQAGWRIERRNCVSAESQFQFSSVSWSGPAGGNLGLSRFVLQLDDVIRWEFH